MPKADEQHGRSYFCCACIEAGAEFLEEFVLAQRAVRMSFGPPHLLALDAAACYQVDADLVPDRGAGDFGIVVLVGFDEDPTHQVLYVRTLDKAVGVFGKTRPPRDHCR